jgi:hypothetical protein
MQRSAVLVLCLMAAGAAHARPPEPVELLKSVPPTCVAERFGRVTVKLGSKEPNQRTGMNPSPVSYRKAFAKLQKEAGELGGHAVVLRGHDADFYSKNARVARLPTFLQLSGDVVNLKPDLEGCRIVALDAEQFAQDALEREGEKVTLHNTTVY